MTQQTTPQTPERVIADADIAIRQLEQARRESCAEYNERIRKLRGAMQSLQTARTQHSDEMFRIDTVISPDILGLIAQPSAGL